MHNLINKFEAEVSQTDDAGVVAIEYVVMAGVVITAVGALACDGCLRGPHRRDHDAQSAPS